MWAKRKFKEKMIAMVLASAIGFGEIDLVYAEAEGKRLSQQATVLQTSVKAIEKAARAKAKARAEDLN
jgi:hypothetical protein